MSVIVKKFYNIFWQNKSCQNLFMLSKHELLETTSFGLNEDIFSYSLNRIIITNIGESGGDKETIKLRNENENIQIDNSIETRIKIITPILEEFVDKRFKKSLEKLSSDIENKGWKLFLKVIRLLANEDKREKNTIDLLQHYGFIGKQINSFEGIEDAFEDYFSSKKGNMLINEKTIKNFLEGINYIKELYVNNSFEKLYNTNQVLLNTLNSEDNFESRIKLFHLLFESGIILPSEEDAHIQCSHCPPNVYKGVFKLQLDPNKLSNLTCPVCSNKVTYFVPYALHKDIFNIVNDKDGLLLNALSEKLARRNINHLLNQNFLNDIEIDCVIHIENTTYIIETKMYKVNTTRQKSDGKIKKHFGKLVKDVKRISEIKEYKKRIIVPILLLNVFDDDILKEINFDLKENNNDVISQSIFISNLNTLTIN